VISAVLDTNVLASGFVGHGWNSAVVQVLDAWRARMYQLVLSDHILDELEQAFSDPYFRRRLAHEDIIADLRLLREQAILTPITVTITGVATHPEDDLVLATAVSAKADYLVTGDGQLQKLRMFGGVSIVSPRAFLDRLAT
jgi:uncharacterized protein